MYFKEKKNLPKQNFLHRRLPNKKLFGTALSWKWLGELLSPQINATYRLTDNNCFFLRQLLSDSEYSTTLFWKGQKKLG